MIAVIYYAYGAPKSIDEIEAYFSHIMKGKAVPAPMLANITALFKKSGYPDFIRSSTERIAAGLEAYVGRIVEEEVRVYPAYKHTPPFVEDVYALAQAAGATKIVTLAVNPILSTSGGGAVHSEVAALHTGATSTHIAIDHYHLDEQLIRVYADRVSRAISWLPLAAQQKSYVLFTVHSQPLDAVRNAPYVQQFTEMAQAIAASAGVTHYATVYRSGRAEGWLGPDVKDKMKELAKAGVTGIVTCELLSVSADVESYNEINLQCQEVAEELQLAFATSEFLGDSYDTVEALGALIVRHLQ